MQLSAVIHKEGRLYVALNPQTGVASQGKTVEQAVANLKEAVELFLEDEDAPEIDGPVFLTTFEVGHDAKVSGPLGA